MRERFRVLMLARFFPPEFSGAALQALSLARELRLRGHAVEFVVFGGRSGTQGAVEGFPVTRVEEGRGAKHREVRLWWELLRLLVRRKGAFDILHSHGAYFAQAVVGPLGRLFDVASVAKASLSRNDLQGARSRTARFLHRRMLRSVDACVAISAELEQEFLSAGMPRERVVRIPNGVDVERFRPATPDERLEARRVLGLPGEAPILLYAGVFDQRKNIEWLARRWIGADAYGTAGLLLAVGPVSRDDADRRIWSNLEQLSRQHPHRLQVRGYFQPVEVCYHAADCLVLPSLSEGLPNVVLEAMACGLPCAVSAAAGTRELIRNDLTGHTFAPWDEGGLAAAIRACLGERRAQLGRAARSVAVDQYGIAAVAAAYEALYASISRKRLAGAARSGETIQTVSFPLGGKEDGR